MTEVIALLEPCRAAAAAARKARPDLMVFDEAPWQPVAPPKTIAKKKK